MPISPVKPASPVLRLGHGLEALRPTLHNGPGWRIALWLQGCSLRCTSDCLNPHLLAPHRGVAFTVDALSAALLRLAETADQPIDGITVLGGEPFDQAEALAPLLESVRRAGLSVMVYTGHRLEDLEAAPPPGVARLLALTDLLVDGPFLPEFHDDTLGWRGSSNQRLICFGDRFTADALEESQARQGKAISIRLRPEGFVSISGLQAREDICRITGKSRVSNEF